VDFNLDPKDTELLHRILSYDLSELRMEISNTDRQELCESLKADEERIKVLIARLEAAASSA
jgi:hypothetical protein